MSTILITGANRGIGLELSRQLKERGDDVLAVCRTETDELRELGVHVIAGIDVTKPEDVERLDGEVGKELGEKQLDVLIHNAGVLHADKLGELDFDKLREQFEVNSLSPLRVTERLLPRLGQGSKLAVITSMMGSMTDNESGSYYGYRMSKAAVNAAFVSLTRDLEPRGIPVAILHPGYVKTRMTGWNGNLTTEESARGLIAHLDALTMQSSGTFWHATGDVIPW
jgi:NAD(P)-dependent dehydrogenase (short-subunit alcohol dehydrogenase family)